MPATPAAPDAAWNRFVDLVLDGLRTTAATPAARPPAPAQVRRAMRTRAHDLGYG